MKIFLCSLLFLSAFFMDLIATAQHRNDSSLVHPGEISFNSPFEKKNFQDLLENNNPSYLYLFLCNDSTINQKQAEEFNSVFKQTVGRFKTEYYAQLNEKKKIQKIYSSVHDEMLEKYVPFVPFSSVFLTKEYHCVSSSMLFALVFDELNIPYEVRKIPGHVYIVTYPATHYITVETTDPLHGTIIYDQAFKASYIEYLRDSKLISKEEYNGSDLETLFKKYFNVSSSIDLTELASLQYINQVTKHLQNLEFHEALDNQEKAWLLNPDTLNTYMLLFCRLGVYNSLDKGDIECAEQLAKISRFTGKGINADIIIGEFALITQKQLLYEGNVQLFDSSYAILESSIKDSALSNEISFLYHYEKGRILCNNSDYEQALYYTKKAYQLKPRNSDAKNNFILALNNALMSMQQAEKLDLVNKLAIEIPVLLEDNLFVQLRLSMYLMMMDKSYYEKDPVRGEEYRKQFEALYPLRISKYQYVEGDIVMAYGTASSYYFRIGQTAKTRAILEKGLEYAPNSYDLKNRLNAVK